MSCPTNETYFVPVLYLYLENLIHYPDFMNITMEKTCFSYKQSIGNPLCYAIYRLRAHLPKLLIYLTSFLTFIAATLPPPNIACNVAILSQAFCQRYVVSLMLPEWFLLRF